MGILQGLDADVWVTGTPSIALGAPESCTNVDGGTFLRYRAATHFYWDKYATLVVQCSPNGSTGWATVTDYTFEYPGGYVQFATARTAGVNNFVRINAGNYFTVAQLASCHSWELSMKANVIDTTIFQQNAWGSSQAALKKASGKIESFLSDGTLDAQLAGLLVFVLYLQKTTNLRMEMYGWLTDVMPKSSMAGVVEKSISFEADGTVYYRTTA